MHVIPAQAGIQEPPLGGFCFRAGSCNGVEFHLVK
jgi:hypothetical protein